MLIHAYRRKDATPVHTGKTNIEFKPNDAGDVVADVTDADDIDVLLAIGEGYRAYEGGEVAAKPDKPVKTTTKTPTPTAAELAEAAAKASAAANAGAGAGADDGKGTDDKPFLLKGEKPEDDVDLGAMDLAALKEFAKANTVRVHHTWSEEKVRQTIFEAFTAE